MKDRTAFRIYASETVVEEGDFEAMDNSTPYYDDYEEITVPDVLIEYLQESRMTRPPPHSPEAEAAVLGSCLLEPTLSIHTSKSKGVSPEHFYLPPNRLVWEAIESCFEKRRTVDFTLLLAELKSRDSLDRVGGEAYLHKLIDETATPKHVEYYAEILCQKHGLRKVIDISRENEAAAYEPDADPKELITNSVSGLIRTVDRRERKKPEEHHAEHVRRRELAQQQGYVGIPSKYEKLNGFINSFVSPDHVIVAALPSKGKSDYLFNEHLNMGLNGIPNFIFSLEMSEYAIRERMASMLSEVNAFQFGGRHWSRDDAKLMDEAYKKLEKLPIYIEHNTVANINDIRVSAAAAKAKWGAELIGVDYVQLIKRQEREYRQDYRLVIEEWASILKGMGGDLNVVTMVLSQFRRYFDAGKKEITPPLPSKELLKEASGLEQGADIIILLAERPGVDKNLYSYSVPVWDYIWIVDKARNGPRGKFDMKYWPSRHKFVRDDQAVVIELEDDMRKEAKRNN